MSFMATNPQQDDKPFPSTPFSKPISPGNQYHISHSIIPRSSTLYSSPIIMDQNRTSTTEWSWPSALAGVAVTATAAALLVAAPRDPTFQVISVSFTSFNLQFPLLDADLVLNVHVCNPNLVPISHGPSFVSLLYDGAVLGTAKIEPGHQSARSCRVVRLRARLDSVELGDHAVRFLADVARRKMALDAAVEMVGAAKVMGWTHRFNVKANGRVEVDPVFLDAIEEENHLGLGF